MTVNWVDLAYGLMTLPDFTHIDVDKCRKHSNVHRILLMVGGHG
jgi:hypothetical protein